MTSYSCKSENIMTNAPFKTPWAKNEWTQVFFRKFFFVLGNYTQQELLIAYLSYLDTLKISTNKYQKVRINKTVQESEWIINDEYFKNRYLQSVWKTRTCEHETTTCFKTRELRVFIGTRMIHVHVRRALRYKANNITWLRTDIEKWIDRH